MMAELHNYLGVGAVLFALGAIGFLTRRNLIVMTLSAELMLQGASLNLVAFSHLHGNYQGQAFAVFIVAVAACEAGVALALFVALYRRKRTLDAGAWRELAEEGLDSGRGVEEPPVAPLLPVHPEFPRLTPAGRVPEVPKRRAGRRV
jgi:NADH-quinone oxidoreductase subunit K